MTVTVDVSVTVALGAVLLPPQAGARPRRLGPGLHLLLLLFLLLSVPDPLLALPLVDRPAPLALFASSPLELGR